VSWRGAREWLPKESVYVCAGCKWHKWKDRQRKGEGRERGRAREWTFQCVDGGDLTPGGPYPQAVWSVRFGFGPGSRMYCVIVRQSMESAKKREGADSRERDMDMKSSGAYVIMP
jgi:putative component of toxin-antitoxin plasmid stabilization module